MANCPTEGELEAEGGVTVQLRAFCPTRNQVTMATARAHDFMTILFGYTGYMKPVHWVSNSKDEDTDGGN